jgi:chromosome segregation ATPase
MSEATTLTEQLQERRDLKPDKFTLAWWDKRFDELKQGYVGANHNINNAVASARDCWAELKTQRDVNANLENELAESQARTGQLQSELTQLTERVEKMAGWINQQRSK